VVDNFARFAHVDPATARRTLDEMLLLVLRLAAAPLAKARLLNEAYAPTACPVH